MCKRRASARARARVRERSKAIAMEIGKSKSNSAGKCKRKREGKTSFTYMKMVICLIYTPLTPRRTPRTLRRKSVFKTQDKKKRFRLVRPSPFRVLCANFIHPHENWHLLTAYASYASSYTSHASS